MLSALHVLVMWLVIVCEIIAVFDVVAGSVLLLGVIIVFTLTVCSVLVLIHPNSDSTTLKVLSVADSTTVELTPFNSGCWESNYELTHGGVSDLQ